jgi:hypothetical protein
MCKWFKIFSRVFIRPGGTDRAHIGGTVALGFRV